MIHKMPILQTYFKICLNLYQFKVIKILKKLLVWSDLLNLN